MLIDFKVLSFIEDLRESAGMRSICDESIAVGGGYAFVGPPGSWMCVAKGLGIEREVSRAEMAELVEVYRSRGIEPRMDVSCFADGSVLRYAAEMGFQMVETEFLLLRPLNLPAGAMTGAAMTDGAIDGSDALLEARLPGIELEMVDKLNDTQVMEVARAIARGFAADGEEPSPTDVELTARPMRQAETVTVAARIDGRVVGGGMMDVTEVEGDFPGVGSRVRVSGFFALSVLKEARRRGVQLAILRERLRIAKARGAVFAAIGSTPSSPTLRNARRAGFVIAGVKNTLIRPEAGMIGRPRE